MKTLATLLVWASLALGVVAVVTAYTPSLAIGDARLVGLHLNSVAGVLRNADGTPVLNARGGLQPIAAAGAELTPELLARLRESGAAYVRVKEFAWSRWPTRWWFVLACGGLLAGGLIIRRETRRQTAAAADRAASEGPEAALSSIRDTVARLLAEWTATEPETRLARVLDRIGRAQRVDVPAVAAGRELLVARFTLGGYAQIMDAFAAAERQLNRAWSAAADGIEDEALICLRRADEMLGHLTERCSAGR
jgi:hypothetical protein